ncbi:MAG: DNA mismatch repair protein MutS [Holosporales bacterium]|jgi:DNA mismatch repair protein MutS|nr:DNA mismatch repair protein MutS [Holosporales bacterium]
MDKDGQSLTPMMQQYMTIKEKHADFLLFYRLGDFYELFYDDAIVASKELGLVLTQRVGVPMCGVPWHASEMYLNKLVRNGHRVAICEQLETPEDAKRRGGSKATVDRQVTRLVTNGTLVEQSMLAEKDHNFLMAISGEKDKTLGIAYADVSVGRFLVEEINLCELQTVITKIAPSEIICADSLLSKREILESLDSYKPIVRAIPSPKFMVSTASERLAKFFNVRFIDAFGNLSACEVEAASAIVEYVSDVYKSDNVCLSFPQAIKQTEYMSLDNFTRKGLELTNTNNGERRWSLLSNIDKTVTAQGARMLSCWLMEPLNNIEAINCRLDYVEFFVKNPDVLNGIRKIMANFPDIERSLARILLDKAGPRDLKCVAIALKKSIELHEQISQYEQLSPIKLDFVNAQTLINRLESALVENLPAFARDGGFIKNGYDQELDSYTDILENSENVMKALQRKYVEETGIQNLKIKKTAIVGYFIEATTSVVPKIPYYFRHRQTMASCVRYTTDELLNTANGIYAAESNAKYRELTIFNDLIRAVSREQSKIRTLSNNLSLLDVTSSLAQLAIENNYIRPVLTTDKILDIKNGRHPVVENSLRNTGTQFVANDCTLNETGPVSILTGPNMGGKSTFLRQNAIIVIMAQIGSFVPADKAHIGLVDRIFSRVGASDDIASGRSTFMVEMIETATILRQATAKSFIILDEIGRGTSTYDGLAIAWAVIEDIACRMKARTLFATHYHELRKISETVPYIQFITVQTEEWNDNIVFLHKIVAGFADKSYGINVASLAGFPQHVLDRAEEVLKAVPGQLVEGTM